MKNLFTYLKTFLVVYIASYLLVNPLFLHIHEIDGEKIAHSHPLKEASHTSGEAKIIKYFNATQLIEAEYMPHISCVVNFVVEIFTQVLECNGYNPVLHKGQRGPPVI